MPLRVIAPKTHVLLPSETATALLPGGRGVELRDGSLPQPATTIVANMPAMMIAFFIKLYAARGSTNGASVDPAREAPSPGASSGELAAQIRARSSRIITARIGRAHGPSRVLTQLDLEPAHPRWLFNHEDMFAFPRGEREKRTRLVSTWPGGKRQSDHRLLDAARAVRFCSAVPTRGTAGGMGNRQAGGSAKARPRKG